MAVRTTADGQSIAAVRTYDESGNYVAGSGGGGGSSPLGTGVDRSGSITLGNASQQLAAANANRVSLQGQNTSSGDLWITETQAGAIMQGGSGSYQVLAGQTFEVSSANAIQVIGATTGQTWTATEV